MNIKHISAIEELDSRGNPTIKAYVETASGAQGNASIPSGASTGKHEAVELRDKDASVFEGKGELNAIRNIIDIIAPAVKNINFQHIKEVDSIMIELDHTKDKSYLGANAILVVSLAAARAYAAEQNQPLWKTLNLCYFQDLRPALPRLMVNIINGGAHAGWNLDFQEYMVIPKTTSPKKAVEIASETFHALKKELQTSGLSIGVGDEGGFAPKFGSNTSAFEQIQKAIVASGNPPTEVDLGTDIAASEFFSDNLYRLKVDNKSFSADELLAFYQEMILKFHILSIEDPFAEEDWERFAQLTALLGKDHMIVGDDLYTTNPERIRIGIQKKATNAIIIKPNQIGSLMETVEAIKLARSACWNIIISHRSGETEDTFIADLAVACGAEFLKAGSMSRSERLVKYNRLIEIEALEIKK